MPRSAYDAPSPLLSRASLSPFTISRCRERRRTLSLSFSAISRCTCTCIVHTSFSRSFSPSISIAFSSARCLRNEGITRNPMDKNAVFLPFLFFFFLSSPPLSRSIFDRFGEQAVSRLICPIVFFLLGERGGCIPA